MPPGGRVRGAGPRTQRSGPAALSVSDLPGGPVLIAGFRPRAAPSGRRFLDGLADTPHTTVFFEAPHRIVALLKDLLAGGATGTACVGRR